MDTVAIYCHTFLMHSRFFWRSRRSFLVSSRFFCIRLCCFWFLLVLCCLGLLTVTLPACAQLTLVTSQQLHVLTKSNAIGYSPNVYVLMQRQYRDQRHEDDSDARANSPNIRICTLLVAFSDCCRTVARNIFLQ